MKLRMHRECPSSTSEEPTSEVLFRDGLLARWFLTYRLEEELERARRNGRPVAVVAASAQLLPGEALSQSARLAAAAAAKRSARRCDLVGWLDDARVVLVMPDAKPTEAQAAGHRIQSEMFRGSMSVGGHKWTVVEIHDARSFRSAADLLDSVTHPQNSAAA